ncbi:hypothetical protein B0O99DRAFT_649979 [Bisporella sp. PMI_857]|nr:hypothetical protein B0O99DRAFT_649979 [Bisporella sp. PMI_857]
MNAAESDWPSRLTSVPFGKLSAMLVIATSMLVAQVLFSFDRRLVFKTVEFEPSPIATWGWYPCSPQPANAIPRGSFPTCAEKFGHQYLEKFRDNLIGYCTSDSSFNLTCFHSRMLSSSELDSFCFGRSAVFDPTQKRFRLGFHPRTLSKKETSEGIPQINALRTYWYETGPGVIFKNAVTLDSSLEPTKSGSNFTILIKREIADNTWHALMEIWPLTMTIDVLRMTMDPATSAPFFEVRDAKNTRVVIVDNLDDGPYFDLWTLFAERPPIRLKDVPDRAELESLTVPLPGSSNPMWSGEWEPHSCVQSDLLRTFSQRILGFYKIGTQRQHSEKLILTFLDRKKNRRIHESSSYLKELQAMLPHVEIQVVDFSIIPFSEQLRVVRGTDILVGVHGARLTHGLFLKENSVMVEIPPENFYHKGFRNLAGLAGHIYFSAHGKALNGTKGDWQNEDVAFEKERFMELIQVGVKSLYNRGSWNYDVN